MDLKSRGIIPATFVVFLVACHSTEENQFDDLPGPCIIRKTKLPRLEPVKVKSILSFYNNDISHDEIKKYIIQTRFTHSLRLLLQINLTPAVST